MNSLARRNNRIACRNSRRHIDRRIRAIRHCDGIQDIGLKIKEKARSLYEEFKQLSGGQKIAKILLKIMQGVGLVFAAKNAADIKSVISQYKQDIAVLPNLVDSWALPYAKGSEKKVATIKALKFGVKALAGLMGAFISLIGEKYIKADKELES